MRIGKYQQHKKLIQKLYEFGLTGNEIVRFFALCKGLSMNMNNLWNVIDSSVPVKRNNSLREITTGKNSDMYVRNSRELSNVRIASYVFKEYVDANSIVGQSIDFKEDK